MNVEIIHPEMDSITTIEKCIVNNQPIRRSPHVGNVNARELAVVLGISQMGGVVHLEMVDTIQGQDSYSMPRSVITAEATLQLASGKSTKGRVVGACNISEEVIAEVQGSGLHVLQGDSLLDVHQRALAAVLPESVRIRTSSMFFASLGTAMLQSVLGASAKVIDRPLRVVDQTGKITQASEDDLHSELFGCGDVPLQGILPPLEAMMALEFISGVKDGVDGSLVHVAGPDMIMYTRDPQIMDKSLTIASMALADHGLSSRTSLEYIVPGLEQLLGHPDFSSPIDTATIQSQHDLQLVSTKA